MFRYQVEGAACYTNYSDKGVADSFVNATFRVAVDGSKVYLRLDYASDHYSEWTFDGADSYLLLDSPDRVNPVPGLNAAATVTRDEFPTTATPWHRNIWLGLASAHYLANATNRLVQVPWLLDGLAGARSYRWRMERFPDAAGLPKAISFIASEEMWEREQASRLEKITRRFPLKEGFVGGEFRVHQAQTLGGVSLPTFFTLERYRVTPDFSAERLLGYYVVRVTNFSPTVSVAFRPKIRRATDVSDMRDSTEALPLFGIIYPLTDDSWLALADPNRLAMLEAHKPAYWNWRASLKTIQIGPWRTSRAFLTKVAIVTLCCIALVAIVWLIRITRGLDNGNGGNGA